MNNPNPLVNLTPTILWNNFYQLTQIPRKSKHEDRVREWLIQKAKKNSWKYKIDDVGNVYLYVKATNSSDETIIIQNHMDMVCDKLPEIKHNFLTDPLKLVIQDGWIKAFGTTLGADNGIGVAIALSLAEDTETTHPNLELFFTVDEETGLNGAKGFNSTFLSAKKMINIDTEEWGSLYVGCAGGEDLQISKTLKTSPTTKSNIRITIDGCKGGHSGIEIHKKRLNAIKVLSYILNEYSHKRSKDINKNNKSSICFIESIIAGKAHNIIPKYLTANLFVEDIDNFSFFCKEKIKFIKLHGGRDNQNISCQIQKLESENCNFTLDQDSNNLMLKFMTLAPHGVFSTNYEEKESLAEQSTNFASIKLQDSKLECQFSLRFNSPLQYELIREKLETILDVFNFEVKFNGYYPSWQSSGQNPFLDLAIEKFKNFEKEVQVKSIHAGLECGLISDKLKDVDIVSLGPNINGAHTVNERLEIESTQKLWKFLQNFIASV